MTTAAALLNLSHSMQRLFSSVGLMLVLIGCGEGSDAQDAAQMPADVEFVADEDSGLMDVRAPMDAMDRIDASLPPDAEPSCRGVNPSRLNDRDGCWSGSNGACCGDVVWEMICEGGEWQCPPGFIPLWQCQTHCEMFRG